MSENYLGIITENYDPTIFHSDLLFSFRKHLVFYITNDESQGVFFNLKSKQLRISNSLY